jgi:membrane associated rhomboid family serine protease
MAFMIAVFVGADYLVLRRIDALTERALFVLWICRFGALHALLWSCAMLIVGGLQLHAEARLGGHDALLSAFGAVRQLVGDEPWRVVVGPFLHGNVVHWLGNLAMLAVASAIVGPLMPAWRAVALFVCASSFGAVVSFAIEATSPDAAYVGVSAGIFALLGWCVGAAVRRPAGFPRGFIVTATGFAVLNVALAALAAPTASNAGHIAGLALGLLWGVVLPPACTARA